MTNLSNAFLFLTNFLFDFYISLVLLRFILQLVRAPFNNDIGQFIIKLTNPGVLLFRKFVPGIRGIDFATVALAYLLAILKMLMVVVFSTRGFLPVYANFPAYLLLAFICLIELTLTIYFWGIILRVILSFMVSSSPSVYNNPFYTMVYLLTEPVLSFIRKFVPLIGGFDLSPMIALLMIAVLRIVFNV